MAKPWNRVTRGWGDQDPNVESKRGGRYEGIKSKKTLSSQEGEIQNSDKKQELSQTEPNQGNIDDKLTRPQGKTGIYPQGTITQAGKRKRQEVKQGENAIQNKRRKQN